MESGVKPCVYGWGKRRRCWDLPCTLSSPPIVNQEWKFGMLLGAMITSYMIKVKGKIFFNPHPMYLLMVRHIRATSSLFFFLIQRHARVLVLSATGPSILFSSRRLWRIKSAYCSIHIVRHWLLHVYQYWYSLFEQKLLLLVLRSMNFPEIYCWGSLPLISTYAWILRRESSGWVWRDILHHQDHHHHSRVRNNLIFLLPYLLYLT